MIPEPSRVPISKASVCGAVSTNLIAAIENDSYRLASGAAGSDRDPLTILTASGTSTLEATILPVSSVPASVGVSLPRTVAPSADSAPIRPATTSARWTARTVTAPFFWSVAPASESFTIGASSEAADRRASLSSSESGWLESKMAASCAPSSAVPFASRCGMVTTAVPRSMRTSSATAVPVGPPAACAMADEISTGSAAAGRGRLNRPTLTRKPGRPTLRASTAIRPCSRSTDTEPRLAPGQAVASRRTASAAVETA